MLFPLLLSLFPLALQDSAGEPALAYGALQLVETAPVETTLDAPDLPETWEVWLDMLAHADSSIDLLHFYASSRAGSRLEEVIEALFTAADRGVAVRLLLDERFRDEYPETMDRLAAHAAIAVRRVAFDAVSTPATDDGDAVRGGVQHAKAMIVDAEDVYVGSANFDWRSLEHIQELGVRVRSRDVAGAFLACFEADWRAAQHGELAEGTIPTPYVSGTGPTHALSFADAEVAVTPVVSPTGPGDPAGARAAGWDLPALQALIAGAETRVRAQLLTYDANGYDSGYWPELETHLRAAAARGVQVELLLANWCKVPGRIDRLKSLQCLPNVEVRLATIPEWSGGFVPFSRVIHAKYMVVDGERAWLGTSNWQRDYFYTGRNLGLLVDGEAFAARLDAFFENLWTSSYTETVDPGATYEAPRIGE